MGPLAPNWLVERIAAEHIARAANQWARGRVLDVGCGAMPYAHLFDDYTGLEFDVARYPDVRPHIAGSALELPVCDVSFDTVFSSQVLEHVPEPWRMVEEMARVPHDYFRFTCYGLQHLAERAGLEVLEVHPMAGYWVTAGARFCYYIRRFQRRLFGPLMGPVYALIQCAAWGLDRVHRVDSDAWNYLVVARRPEIQP